MTHIAAWTGGLVLALLLEGCGLNILAGGSVGTDNPAVNVETSADVVVDTIVDAQVGGVVGEDSLVLELRVANQNPVLSPKPVLDTLLVGQGNFALDGYLRPGVDYVLSVYRPEDLHLVDMMYLSAGTDTTLVVQFAPASVDGSYVDSSAGLPADGEYSTDGDPAYAYLPGTRLSWTYTADAEPWRSDLPTGSYRLLFADAAGRLLFVKVVMIP